MLLSFCLQDAVANISVRELVEIGFSFLLTV